MSPLSTWSLAVAAAVVVGLSACRDNPIAGPEPVPTIEAVSGADQVGVAGAPLATALTVRVRVAGEPKAGVTIIWRPSSGAVTAINSQSDEQGLVVAQWVLGPDPGPATLEAAVAVAGGPTVVLRAEAIQPVLSVDPATDGQTGAVGARLAKPIRVIVVTSKGPQAGLRVDWRTTLGGSVEPASSLTDSTGSATAEWVLHTTAREQIVVASIRGVADTLVFHAVGLPGPPVDVHGSGGNQGVAVNQAGFHVRLGVVDQYGNVVPDVPVSWSVTQGHLRRLDAGAGQLALFAPDGIEGPAVIQASAIGKSVEFAITVGPPELFVALEVQGNWGFLSVANGSRPAVDTISAGTTVTWLLLHAYAFDDPHTIIPAGSPSFAAAGFVRRGDVSDGYTARIRFPTAGVYHYSDDYDIRIGGTLVVR